MRSRRLLLLVCGLALWAARGPAADSAADLPKGHLDGYIAMVNADRARDRGQYKAALQAYQEARLNYQKVGRENPAWHPEIVQYRLTYCANQIEALTKQAGKSEAELLAEPEAVAEGDLARTRAKYADLMKEFTALQARGESAQRELKQAQGDVLARDGEIARLREDINRARDQLLASTNTMAAANNLAQNVMASLEEENRRLKANLQAQADAEKLAAQEYRRVQTELEGVVLSDIKVRDELAAARAQLSQQGQIQDKSGAEVAALRKEIAGLREQAQTHAADLKKREDQLAPLKAENQKLSDERSRLATAQGQLEKVAAQATRDLESTRNDAANLKAQLTALEQKHRVTQGDADRMAATETKAREELATVARRRDELSAELAKSQGELARARGDLEALTKNQSHREETLADWAKERSSLTQDVARAQAELTKAQGELTRTRGEMEAAAKSQAAREDAFANWAKERGGLTQEVARAQAELSRTQAELKAAQVRRGEVERLDKEAHQLRDRLAAAQAESQQKGKDLDSLQAEYRKALAEVEPLRDAAKERQTGEEKREAELARRDAEIAALKATTKEAVDRADARTRMHETLLENHQVALKRLADVSARFDKSDAKLKELQEAFDQAAAERAKLEEHLAQAEKRAAALSETVDLRGRELTEARQMIEQLKKKAK